eukprot:s1362_g28.t1
MDPSRGDERLLGPHKDQQGKRFLDFKTAMTLMKETEADDWYLQGPRVFLEFMRSIRSGPGDIATYHLSWAKNSGVKPHSMIAHEHRIICNVIRASIEVDQINAAGCLSFELLARRLVQVETAVARNPQSPDFSGLELVLEDPVGSGGEATTSVAQEKAKAEEEKDEVVEPVAPAQTLRLAPRAKDTGSRFVRILSPGTVGRDPKALQMAVFENCKHDGPGQDVPFFQSREELHKHGAPFLVDVRNACGPKLVTGAFQALNDLAGFKFDKMSQQPCRPPTKVQQQMIEHVQQLVQDSGGPPEGLTGQTSLAHLARSISSYDETPSNLADYDISKIKILRSQVRPKNLVDLLPTSVKPFITDLRRHVERDPLQVEAELAVDPGAMPKVPYWDPVLRSSPSERVNLMRRMFQIGLVDLQPVIRARAGLFFVKKKTPGAIRLIVDGRQANFNHRKPPVTRLGSASCLAELRLQHGQTGYARELDVSDCLPVQAIAAGTARRQLRAPDCSGHCRTATASSRAECTAGLHLPAPELSRHGRTSSASSRSQCALPDFIRELQIPVGTAGLHPRAPDSSGHCRTSTASLRSQWALPDFIRELQMPVGTAGLQPRASDPSGHCRTSSASSRCQWALPDFNRELQIPVGTAGLKNVR